MHELRLRLQQFLGFWYDFLIGDDWMLAAAVVVVLALSSVLNRSDVALQPFAWTVAPIGVLLLHAVSLGRTALSSMRAA